MHSFDSVQSALAFSYKYWLITGEFRRKYVVLLGVWIFMALTQRQKLIISLVNEGCMFGLKISDNTHSNREANVVLQDMPYGNNKVRPSGF